MASLDELERPSPIEEFLDTVAQIVMPKKEYLGGRVRSSTGTPDSFMANQHKVDDAVGRPRMTGAEIDSFYAGPSYPTQASWDTAVADFNNSIQVFIQKSFKTRADWERTSGLTSEEFSRLRTFDEMETAMAAKYGSSSPDTGGTPNTPNTPNTPDTGTGTGTAAGTKGVNPITGKPEGSHFDNRPLEEQVAEAEARVKELKLECAKNPALCKQRFQNWRRWTGGAAVAATAAALVGYYSKALATFIASNGAEIDFKTIKTKPATALGVTVPFMTPTDVDVTWTARKVGSPGGILSAVRTPPGCGIIFHESDLPEVEKHTEGVGPTEVKDSKKEFSVSTETGDSSGIDRSNQGWGKISLTFDDALNDAFRDPPPGFPSPTSLFPGLPNALRNPTTILNTIIVIIIIGVVLAIMGPIIMKLFENIMSSR